MKTVLKPLCVLALVAPFAMPAAASEAEFLRSLEGSWNGRGEVRMRPDSRLVSVSCSLDTEAEGEALTMDGSCRTMVVFSRRIGADLRADGVRYRGSYTGSPRGTATLAGTRAGGTIVLDVLWPGGAAGTPPATMQVASLGEGRMRLVTVEPHPETGENVVTARLEFSRR